MTYDLRRLSREAGLRKNRTLAPIEMTEALKRDLYRLTLRPVRAWQQAVAEQVLPAYGRALDSLTRDDESDDIAEIIRIAEALVEGRTVQVTAEIEDWLKDAVRWHEQRWAASVKAAAGIDVFPLLSRPESLARVRAFRQRISSLVRNISETARKDIEEAVWRGLAEQTPRRQIGKELSERLGLQRARANRIAIDQAQKLNGKLTELRMEEAGLTQYEWRHSGKVRFRPEHKARNGKVYALGYPRGDTPGLKPFCGCVQMPVIDVEDA